jgi:peptidyl-prolyl cis-trans isomerase D
MAMNALRTAAKDSKFMKFILGGFIFLAVGGLVFTDINGFFRGGLPNNTIASVNNEEITLSDFDRSLRRTLQQLQTSPQQAYEAGLVHAFLQARIDLALQNQANQYLNLRISDELIAQKLKIMFGDSSKDEIESLIRARGISENELAFSIRNQITQIIHDNLPKGITNLTPNFLNQALSKAHNEERSGVIYSFPASKLTNNIEVMDEDIQNYYDDIEDQYKIPSTRRFIIGSLTPEDIPSDITKATETDIQNYYEDNKNDFQIAEKRKISQAVVKDADQAQSIYELTQNDVSLVDAVQDITGNSLAYRKAETFEKTGMPQELSALAFDEAIKKNQITPPVETLIGWHIMKITDITPATQRPITKVQKEIKTIISEQKLYDVLYEKMTLTEEMIDSGATFEKIMADTGIKTTKTQAISEDTEELPKVIQDIVNDNPSIRNEIFSLSENMASYPVELENGGYIVIGAMDIKEESFIPLKTVKSDIQKKIKEQRTESQAKSILAGLMIESNIEEIIKKYKPKKQSFRSIKNNSSNKNADIIFKTPYKNLKGYIRDNTAYIVSVEKTSYSNKNINNYNINYTDIFNAVQNQYLRENADIMVNENLLLERYGN